MTGTCALIVAAGDTVSGNALARQARLHDLVVGVDGGAAALMRAGVTPAVVIGDFDSLSEEDLERLRHEGVSLRVHPRDKSHTDLELALEWCRGEKLGEVTVVGVWGERQDHSLAAIGTLARYSDLRPAIIYKEMTGWIVDPAHRGHVGGFARDTTVSVLALVSGTRISVVGMKWTLEDRSVESLSDLGVSNVSCGPESAVTVHSGMALVLAEVPTNQDSRPDGDGCRSTS
ncbi:MAG: thiamine diphosphokinase [Coriobacteriia bacterium]|nr:thiamine diphosphokinase [Coriobacteriia bacterium]